MTLMANTMDERKTDLPPVEPELKSDTMQSILTFNGGSSSIKFTLYQTGEPLERRLYGKIDRIALSDTNLTFNQPTGHGQHGRHEEYDHGGMAWRRRPATWITPAWATR